MARIAEQMKARQIWSFELYPPKTDDSERMLDKAVVELDELSPAFVSVTYGALGSTRERTRDLALRLASEFPFDVLPHLTCVGHTKADIATLLDDYAAAGMQTFLALGGDAPKEPTNAGEFQYAVDLIAFAKERYPQLSVAVAAHPEVHPRSSSRESDRRHLATKLRMADFGLTQFFFTIDHYFRMCDELEQLGCDTPVLPGVMPITNLSGLWRMAGMNGTSIPQWLVDRLDAAAGSEAEISRIGVDVAAGLCDALLARGAPGVHIYAMNRSESTIAVLDKLGWATRGEK